MPLHEASECMQEVVFGNAPASYFLIGVLEIFSSAFVCVILFNRNCFPSLSRSKMVTYILPVYLTVVIPLLILCFLIGIHCVMGIFVTSKDLLVIKWTALRFFSEGLSIFLLHPGIGIVSFRRSATISFFWALANGAAVIGALFGSGFHAMLYTTVGALGELILYYSLLVVLPAKWLHRRPATLRFSLANLFILFYQLSVVISYLATEPHRGVSISCLVEMSFSITEYLQICAILYAFCLDSQFWQGLYISDDNNLNEPLRGIWDMNRQEVNLVAQSVFQLERKVVPIIPFNQLRVDTSKYFSGGTARVYRGNFQQNDVAIKFLFCIELTPKRVVDFCHEATMLNSLRHENIVTCHGVAIMPPAISLVTEYCIWGSLFDFLHATDLICAYDEEEEEEEEEVDYDDDVESEDEESEVSSEDNEDDPSFFSGNTAADASGRPRLATNDTKDSYESQQSRSRMSRAHSQSRGERMPRRSRHGRKQSQNTSSITEYVSSLWSKLFHPSSNTSKQKRRYDSKRRSKQYEQNSSSTQNPVHTRQSGLIHFPPAAAPASVANDSTEKEQTMSVDRAIENREQFPPHQLSQFSLKRYLDPDEHGEEADPQDVATKLANAMTASMESRALQSYKDSNSRVYAARNRMRSPTVNSYTNSNTSKPFFGSMRLPRSRLSSSESNSSAVSNNHAASANEETSATSNSNYVSEKSKQSERKIDVDDPEISWHSLSVSHSLLSKHHINAAVFLTPTPIANAANPPHRLHRKDSASSRTHANTSGKPHIIAARLHHSHHHINVLHHSSSSHHLPRQNGKAAQQGQSAHKKRHGKTTSPTHHQYNPRHHSSGSLRWSDGSEGHFSHRKHSSGKMHWKSPAAVMLTAEMGFGMGPRMSGGASGSSADLNNSRNARNVSTAAHRGSYSGSLASQSSASYGRTSGNVPTPTASKLKHHTPAGAVLATRSRNNSQLSNSSSHADSANSTGQWAGAFNWSPLTYLFGSNLKTSPTVGNRKRLNTNASATSAASATSNRGSFIIGNYNSTTVMRAASSDVEPSPAFMVPNHNALNDDVQVKKYELKRSLLPASSKEVAASIHDDILSASYASGGSKDTGWLPTSSAAAITDKQEPRIDHTSVPVPMVAPTAPMNLQTSLQSLGHLLPISVRFTMMRDCAAGLAYLHSRGFMHCDIKSLNFLVTHQLKVKLADLGEARVLLPSTHVVANLASSQDVLVEDDFDYEEDDHGTLSSKSHGTKANQDPMDNNAGEEESLPSNINWSSPETLQRSLMRHDGYLVHVLHTDVETGQVRPPRKIKVNESADVWSLAMVMYEILSGEVPFDTEECRSLSFELFLTKVRNGLRPTIPVEFSKHAWLRELIGRAWAFRASRRCTAAELRDVINSHIRPRATTPTVVHSHISHF